MVECPPLGPDGTPLQLVGLGSAIIQNPKAWEASGHVAAFDDRCGNDRVRHFVALIISGICCDESNGLGPYFRIHAFDRWD